MGTAWPLEVVLTGCGFSFWGWVVAREGPEKVGKPWIGSRNERGGEVPRKTNVRYGLL